MVIKSLIIVVQLYIRTVQILYNDNFLQIYDQLPHLKAIVQYKGKLSKEYPSTYTV